MTSRTLYIPADSFAGAMRVAHAVASGIVTPLRHYDSEAAARARADELSAVHRCTFGVHAIPVIVTCNPATAWVMDVWPVDQIGSAAATLLLIIGGPFLVGLATLIERLP